MLFSYFITELYEMNAFILEELIVKQTEMRFYWTSAWIAAWTWINTEAKQILGL